MGNAKILAVLLFAAFCTLIISVLQLRSIHKHRVRSDIEHRRGHNRVFGEGEEAEGEESFEGSEGSGGELHRKQRQHRKHKRSSSRTRQHILQSVGDDESKEEQEEAETLRNIDPADVVAYVRLHGGSTGNDGTTVHEDDDDVDDDDGRTKQQQHLRHTTKRAGKRGEQKEEENEKEEEEKKLKELESQIQALQKQAQDLQAKEGAIEVELRAEQAAEASLRETAAAEIAAAKVAQTKAEAALRTVTMMAEGRSSIVSASSRVSSDGSGGNRGDRDDSSRSSSAQATTTGNDATTLQSDTTAAKTRTTTTTTTTTAVTTSADTQQLQASGDEALKLPWNATHLPWWPDVLPGNPSKGTVRRAPEYVTGLGDDLIEWEVISYDAPRILKTRNILSPEECQSMIDAALPDLERNSVGQGKDNRVSEIRSSNGMFMQKPQQVALFANRKMQNAAQALTGMGGLNWAEATQILRYEPGQKYIPHTDYFDNNLELWRGGERFATMLTVLQQADAGGETGFPNSRPLFPGANSSAPTQTIAVRPEVGGSVLFYNQLRNRTNDPHSLHTGMRVLNGTKWVAVSWLHPMTYTQVLYIM